MYESVNLIAEENHVLVDFDNVPIQLLMFMTNSAKKLREERTKHAERMQQMSSK